MDLNLLSELYGKEVTVNYRENTAHLSKWRLGQTYELDRECVQKLINLDILEEDSGNIETSEVHFLLNIKNLIKNKSALLNMDLNPLLSSLRDVRIDKLLK